MPWTNVMGYFADGAQTSQARQTDEVNPPHYKNLTPEPIDVIEGWGLGYRLGNALKYLARAGRKGDRLTDLKKARWFLDREIAAEETKREEARREAPATPISK